MFDLLHFLHQILFVTKPGPRIKPGIFHLLSTCVNHYIHNGGINLKLYERYKIQPTIFDWRHLAKNKLNKI